MAPYGGCAWGTFGCAGCLTSRSANPRTAATLLFSCGGWLHQYDRSKAMLKIVPASFPSKTPSCWPRTTRSVPKQ
ncbi:hypothetical protein C6A77_16355 [Pseudomonas sp. AFG_SD02_1510_Pfu_092]|nr:hypothetical protein C6A77_16355 [Pseudomonas sp. AFG_SD02_1510_Pfu_092]